MSFIKDLQQRPEEERVVFSAITAGAVALVLFLLWGMTFFAGSNNLAEEQSSSQSASSIYGFNEATSGVSDAFAEFSGQYEELKKAMQQEQSGVSISVDKNGKVQTENIIIGPENNNREE